jgi:SAM-dependent methyltransferase
VAKRKGARMRELAELLARGTREHYLDPLLYDHEYVDQAADVDWYVELADARAGAGPILELGAGTGRITIPVARGGHKVYALDRMEPMLEHLHQKLRRLEQAGEAIEGSVEPLLADMTEIPLADASVNLVIAPFNCLMHLYSWRELLTCFREVQRVLVPGGCFAFDILLPDLEWLRWDPNERHAVTRFEHPRTGEKMIYSTNHEYDDDTQVCHIRIYYDRARGGRLRPRREPEQTVHLAHRQIFPEEARLLLATAGFELESHTGDFLGISLNKDVEAQVLVATKA